MTAFSLDTRLPQMGSRRRSGFTLIEVMITVAVIALLAAIAIPSYDFAIRKARRAEARTALMQMMQLEERYFSVKGTYLAFDRTQIMAAAPGSDLTRFIWYSSDSPTSSHYELSGVTCGTDCIRLNAAEESSNVAYFKDTECGSYWIQSDGTRGNVPASGSNCW